MVTIEYDIREDDPEGTEVFKLEPSSGELIGKLVHQRFPDISDVDVGTIAEFSGGNARIAIALASRLEKNESLAGLTEEDLFQRLFLQRHAEDTSLYLAAQACALVYSFQGEPDADSDADDLARLGSMVGMDANAMHRHVAELKGRNLVQSRSIWRALLPHAIANRMAALALRNIRYEIIEAAIITGAPDRLLKSFSRRLGYLHKSPEAVAIVSRWLAPGGVLADIAGYDDLRMTVFKNIAPVAPEAVLSALEDAMLSDNGIGHLHHREDHIRLLRSLAYDASLFGHSAALLSLLAEEGGKNTHANPPLDAFVSLFHIYLSGTHATAGQRLEAIKAGLSSDRPVQNFIALRALYAMLEATHFSSHYSFDFGARPRDYGFCPRMEEDILAWFSPALKFIEEEVISGTPHALPALGVLASQFRGLWRVESIRGDLERMCQAVSERHFWREGWLALRLTINYDAEGAQPDVVSRLRELEKILRPKDLEQRVRAIVLSNRLTGIDTDDYEEFEEFDATAAGEGSEERLAALLRELGHAVSEDNALFDRLLPGLLAGQGRIIYFGEGLAQRTGDPRAMWEKIISTLKTMDKEKRHHPLLWGFLRGLGKDNSPLVEELLDFSLQDDFLFSWYPGLQTAVKIDGRGMARLMQSLDSPPAKAENYDDIRWNEDWITGADLGRLLQKIAAMPAGFGVVADKLDMRLFVDNRDKRAHAPEIVEVGRELMRAYVPTGRNDNEDRELQRVVCACLRAPEDAGIVRDICLRLKEAAESNTTQPYAHDDLLQGLLKVHPVAALDGFFVGGEDERKEGIGFFESLLQARKNPVDVVPKEALAQWCDQAPDIRYPIAASIISPFTGNRDEAGSRSWSETALYLLERAQDRLAIMRRYTYRFAPMSWSGSRAAIMESNARLLDDLLDHPLADVREFAASEKVRFAGVVEAQRQAEAERGRREDERFED